MPSFPLVMVVTFIFRGIGRSKLALLFGFCPRIKLRGGNRGLVCVLSFGVGVGVGG